MRLALLEAGLVAAPHRRHGRQIVKTTQTRWPAREIWRATVGVLHMIELL